MPEPARIRRKEEDRAQIGHLGEDLAAALYNDLGFTLVERNYRCREGEIDLIAARGRQIVFCEVKTRRTDRWGSPAEAVGHLKQARLRRLASIWLAERRPGAADLRFDVVSVVIGSDGPQVTHVPDAF